MAISKEGLTVLHLSDVHLANEEIIPGVKPKNRLAYFLSEIIDRGITVDVCVITGDLVHGGEEHGYVDLKVQLNSCPWPVRVIAGNHDNLDLGRRLMGEEYWPIGEIWSYSIADRLTIVGLNSSVPGYHHGELSQLALDELERIGAELQSRTPWIIAVHHPPSDIGHWWMDGQGLLKGRNELLQIADTYGARAILCGHVHVAATIHRLGTPILVAPSIAHEVVYDDGTERPLRFRDNVPRALLHRISDEGITSVELTSGGPTWLVNGLNWKEEVLRTNSRGPAPKL